MLVINEELALLALLFVKCLNYKCFEMAWNVSMVNVLAFVYDVVL